MLKPGDIILYDKSIYAFKFITIHFCLSMMNTY